MASSSCTTWPRNSVLRRSAEGACERRAERAASRVSEEGASVVLLGERADRAAGLWRCDEKRGKAVRDQSIGRR